MRLFVAIELDDGAREAIAREQRRLQQVLEASDRSVLRWVSPQHIHLTLAFLGELAEEPGALVTEAMRQPIRCDPFEMVFGGLGLFPFHGAPRVLWLGVMRGQAEVTAVQRQLAERLERLGLMLEDRTFHPHLTLARWRRSRPADRRRQLAAGPSGAVADLRVDAVTLVESRLSSAGPAHIPLCRARLGEEASPPLQS